MENKVYVIAQAQDIPQEEYRNYINPIKTRRYGRLLKRALVTALKAMKDSGVEHPDAIINGTALGCWEESEHLLDGLVAEGESVSMPTHFMQSTHNTVAAMIGIYTKSHGYNSTYSQGRISFESAMLDAFLQLKSGMIHTALVCENDEITPELQAMLEKIELEDGVAVDRSRAVMLCDSSYLEQHSELQPICEIEDVLISHHTHEGDTAEIKYKPCD